MTRPDRPKMSPPTSPETLPPTSESQPQHGTVRLLAGPVALTNFEADRLIANLRRIDADVRTVDAAYVFLLQLRDADSSVDEGRLRELLGESHVVASGPRVWIAPRVG